MARLVFLGTPSAAVLPLKTLVEAGHDIALVVTRPDRRRTRGGRALPSPVKAAAEALGLPVAHDTEAATTVDAELGVVVAYGQIISPTVLDRLPMVNLHFSLLPRWRGAAPVERSVMAGDEETGVCLMAVVPALDEGPVHASVRTLIEERESVEHLRGRLVELGCELLEETLAGGVAELPDARPQQGEPSYAAKLTTSDRLIHWDQPATQAERVVRVGRAWTTYGERRLLVHEAEIEADPVGIEGHSGDGPGEPPARARPGMLVGARVLAGDGQWLRLVTVQPEGRASMDAEAWIRGVHPVRGTVLGDVPDPSR